MAIIIDIVEFFDSLHRTIQLTRTDESSAGFLLSEQKTVEQTSQFSSLHFFISDSFSGNSQEVPGKNSLAG